MGQSRWSIAEKMGWDYRTVKKYVQDYQTIPDAEVKALVEEIKEREKADLYILNQRARLRLHELLDEGKTKMIETIALADRSFQQRRILEGQSTEHIDHRMVVTRLSDAQRELQELAKELEGKLEGER